MEKVRLLPFDPRKLGRHGVLVDGDYSSEIVVPLTNSSGCPATDPLNLVEEVRYVSEDGIVVFRDTQHITDRFARSRAAVIRERLAAAGTF